MGKEDIRVIGEDGFNEFETEGLWQVGETEECRPLAFCKESDVVEDTVCVEGGRAERDRAV